MTIETRNWLRLKSFDATLILVVLSLIGLSSSLCLKQGLDCGDGNTKTTKCWLTYSSERVKYVSDRLESCAKGKLQHSGLSIKDLRDSYVEYQRWPDEKKKQMKSKISINLFADVVKFNKKLNKLIGINGQEIEGKYQIEKLEEQYKLMRFLIMNKSRNGIMANTDNVLKKLDAYSSNKQLHSGLSMFEIKQAYLEYIAWTPKIRLKTMQTPSLVILFNFLNYDEQMQLMLWSKNKDKIYKLDPIERFEKEYKKNKYVLNDYSRRAVHLALEEALYRLEAYSRGDLIVSGVTRFQLRQVLCESLLWSPETRKLFLAIPAVELLFRLIKFDNEENLVGYGKGSKAIRQFEDKFKKEWLKLPDPPSSPETDVADPYSNVSDAV